MKKPEIDPIKRQAAEGEQEEGISPLAPPDAYNPPGNMEPIPEDQMPAIIKSLTKEHVDFVVAIDKFENAITTMMSEGITREIDKNIRDFFELFDTVFIPHHRQEEKLLFPILHKRLLEVGEHSTDKDKTTCVNMMEEEHVTAMQLAAVVFNFFGLSIRLNDKDSRMLVLDAAIEQSKTLIELLRIHIFREDNIVYPLAFKHIDHDVLNSLGEAKASATS